MISCVQQIFGKKAKFDEETDNSYITIASLSDRSTWQLEMKHIKVW